MMRMPMLVKGLELTIVGMLAVFLFLFLLVWLMQLTAFINKRLARWFPETETDENTKEQAGPHIAAAIAACYHTSRRHVE